ncbi:MAG: polymer-forming cytoskeletal protein [Thermoplasmata archaeon]|nr:polymer-forming cytoskeletal protein [Thermoplasmata archaeon]
MEQANLALVAGTETKLTDFTIEVKSTTGESKELSFTGFTEISGTVKTTDGTTTQTMKLDKVVGDIKIYKGSIIIDGKEVSGTVELAEGADVKMLGTLSGGNLTIKVTGDKNATVTIEEENSVKILSANKLILGKGVTLNVIGVLDTEDVASSLEIKSGATVNVTGKVEIKTIDNAGTLNINEDGKLIAATAIGGTGKYNAYSGSMVHGDYASTADTAEFVAFSGSDISLLSSTTWNKIVGKDSEGGLWKYNGEGILSFNNYNGTYNFPFAANIAAIELTGNSKVTYAAAKEFAATVLFGSAAGSIESITSASKATLEIEVDMSKVQVDNLANTLTVISGKADAKPLKMDQAAVSIVVKGSNSDWKASDIKTMNVFGVKTYNLDMNNSALGISIMSGSVLDAKKVFGVTKDADNKAEVKLVSSALYVIAPTAINASSFTAMNESDVDVVGDVFATTSMDVTNTTTVDIDGELTVKDLIVKTDSEMAVKDMVLSSKNGTSSYNAATLEITGDAVIVAGSTFTNNENGKLANSGYIKVLGTFNNKGAVNNSGTISVPALVGAEFADQWIQIVNKNDDLGTTAAMIKKITFTTVAAGYDGSSKITGAVVDFDQKSGAALSDTFDGKLIPAQDGTGFALVLENETALLVVSYDINGEKDKIGSKWTVSVSGTVGTGDAKKTIVANISSTTKVGGIEVGTVTTTDSLFTNVTDESAAALVVKDGGIMVNTGDVVISHAGAGFLVKGAKWAGPVTANCDLTVTGILVGDITSNIGAVTIAETSGEVNGNITATDTVDVKGKLTGNIVTEKAVTISDKGTMKGDISTKATVTVGKKLEGNVTISGKAGDTSVFTTGENTAEFKGTLTYDYEYKATKGSDVKTTGTNKMDIDGKAKFSVTLTAPVDSNTTTDGTPGYFTLALAPTVGATASIEYKLTEGKLMANDMVMPERACVVVEKNTEFEIAKSNSFDVKKAALKISKDATAKISFETDLSPTYGVVKFIMGFETADGYTIYSDVAYALTNCDENANLVVGSNADISSKVSVKKGVNVIINDKVTLNFKGWGLSMEEGAKITLMGTGKVIFEKTSENLYPGDDTKDYDFYTISGTIDYAGNVVEFNGVRFTDDSTIVGVAATSTAESKISTTLLYNEGTASIAAGVGTGAITLGNDAYFLTKDGAKSGDDDMKTLVFGSFIVRSGAVFDATSIKDAFEVVDYKAADDKVVVDKIRLMPTTVGVEGTLNLTANTEVKGVYAGLGTITLAAGKEFKLMDAAKKEAGLNKTAPGGVAAKIVDATDDANGYVLNIVSASPEKTLTLKATTYKIEGETFNVMTLKGDVGTGIITATAAAFLDGVDIQEDASVIGDAVYIIGDSDSIGYLGAKVIYMKDDSATSVYKTLTYEVTFADDDYTVYTYFTSVDFDEISDITITKDLNVKDLTDDSKLDLSGRDVHITVAEGKKLVVDKPLIIGTPITVLGSEGSSIAGKIVIGNIYTVGAEKHYSNAYIVAYSDVDIDDAEFYGYDGKKEAVYSVLDIEDIPYAIIFANENGTVADVPVAEREAGQILSKVDKDIVPMIVGYSFTKWFNYDESETEIGGGSFVGQTNAYAGAKAISVFVTVKFAEGVSYYCDGVEFAIYDTPVKVEYNSVFTAKINNTAKYEGTPLINGKNSFIVTEDSTLTVTGVNPIPVPPEPEPEPVVGDSGLSLTDILLIVLVILIAIMVVILVLRLNRS